MNLAGVAHEDILDRATFAHVHHRRKADFATFRVEGDVADAILMLAYFLDRRGGGSGRGSFLGVT